MLTSTEAIAINHECVAMKVQCYLSEDEIKIAIAEWFKTMGKVIEPGDVVISHSTTKKNGCNQDSYGASFSYEQSSGQRTNKPDATQG